jgi:hypothetical protein
LEEQNNEFQTVDVHIIGMARAELDTCTDT